MTQTIGLSLFLFVAPSLALAVPYHYVDWSSADVSSGTASGVITLPDLSTVTADFEAKNPDGSSGTLNFAQTSGGTNYWVPSAPYVSSQIDNAPPDSDIISFGQRHRFQPDLHRNTI